MRTCNCDSAGRVIVVNIFRIFAVTDLIKKTTNFIKKDAKFDQKDDKFDHKDAKFDQEGDILDRKRDTFDQKGDIFDQISRRHGSFTMPRSPSYFYYITICLIFLTAFANVILFASKFSRVVDWKGRWSGLIFLAEQVGLESLNLREGQPQPGTGFGLSPLFSGMVWTHSALFSFKIWEQTETTMLPAAKIFP